MGRLAELRMYINKELSMIPDEDTKIKAAAHLYGVSFAAAIIAQKRGLDPEIASMAGMLHDIYAYKSGSYEDHAHKGAELSKTILAELHLTSEEENAVIVSAIYHHDDKMLIDAPMDEVIKDADAMHHIYNDLSKDIKTKEQARYENLKKEFGIQN